MGLLDKVLSSLQTPVVCCMLWTSNSKATRGACANGGLLWGLACRFVAWPLHQTVARVAMLILILLDPTLFLALYVHVHAYA